MPLAALMGTASVRAYGRFAPQGDPFFPDVSLLLHCDGIIPGTGVIFTDSSTLANTMTAVGAVTSILNSVKFGTTSMRLHVPGSGLTCLSTPFAFGTGDFTFECWYWNDAAFPPDVAGCFFANDSANTFFAGFGTSIANLTFGPTDTTGWAHGMATGRWYHLAWVRHGVNRTVYVNGVAIGTAADLSGVNFNPNVGSAYVGSSAAGGCVFGNVDDIRVTNGIARYTATFRVPVRAFPNK